MYWGSSILSFINIGGVVAAVPQYISPSSHMEGGSHRSVRENIWLKSGSWNDSHDIERVVSPLSLRGDEGTIGGKKRGIRELLEKKHIACLFQYDSFRLPAVGTLKRYSKALEYEYRVKIAALGTLKRYSIISLTLYLE
jgi:hypothetical protein